ncbi:MAG: DUF1501 domain-containing protein [Fimbriimonadaceae bacterium]|nr:DUF1501 domain-containing protein [Chitinophagales bacterium]
MSSKHNRREFLKYSSLASASLFIPQFLKANNTMLFGDKGKPKVLVVIQLSGGNDGLNCVVPFRNDIYYKSRPDIGLKKEELILLDDETGLNNNLAGLADLFLNGDAVIINNVGYPNPNRSHFRSMDIWQTGSDEDVYWQTGWLGKVLDSSCNNKDCVPPHYALEIDDTMSLALKGNTMSGFAVRDPKNFRFAQQNPLMSDIAKSVHVTDEHHNVAYLHKTLSDITESADYIYETSAKYNSTALYPQDEFGKQLKTIAELIIAEADTRIYYVSLSGFDTHALQKDQQNKKLKQYADALKIFCTDLKANKKFDDTLVMTFSEFGRRVEQNGSRGTDHGTANNIYLVGGGMKRGGMMNALPDLSKLDDGDLIYSIDFRDVYATILDKWLKADANFVLEKDFEMLDFL